MISREIDLPPYWLKAFSSEMEEYCSSRPENSVGMVVLAFMQPGVSQSACLQYGADGAVFFTSAFDFPWGAADLMYELPGVMSEGPFVEAAVVATYVRSTAVWRVPVVAYDEDADHWRPSPTSTEALAMEVCPL